MTAPEQRPEARVVPGVGREARIAKGRASAPLPAPPSGSLERLDAEQAERPLSANLAARIDFI